MKIVKFQNESYGVRRYGFLAGWEFLDVEGKFWHKSSEDVRHLIEMPCDKAEALIKTKSPPKVRPDIGKPLKKKTMVRLIGSPPRCRCCSA